MKGQNSTIRSLALPMSAYGASGGIAEYTRAFLRCLSEDDAVSPLYYLPRYPGEGEKSYPQSMEVLEPRSDSRWSYLWRVLGFTGRFRRLDLIFCFHLYLLPVAVLVKLFLGGRIVLFLYGIEAWEPPKRSFVRTLLGRVDAFIACSAFTMERFSAWHTIPPEAAQYVLPGAVDRQKFTPGEKDVELERELGLNGKRMLFTLARLDPSERYKGIDEMLGVLPELLKSDEDLIYVIGGDGEDRERLVTKAKQLGVSDSVRFPGYIPEPRKVDYYRMADLFVMPGRGEGFGLVYLEALACGVPVVGSTLDASAETLLNGELGGLADPSSPTSLMDAIRNGLRGSAVNGEALDRYSFQAFRKHAEEIVLRLKSPGA